MNVPKTAIPKIAIELARLYEKDGYKLWLVGGWVRDSSSNYPADLDFATDAPPADSLRILSSWARTTWETGIEFGTVGAERGNSRVEVTTLRKESYDSKTRKPSVEFTSDLEEDLSRRDFTINAMALTLPEGKRIDPFDGAADLAKRVIKTPLGPEVSFGDDPLRMLRALRFNATLGFEVDVGVLEAIRQMKDRLSIVSKERVRDELTRLLLGSTPWTALELAVETGLAEEFLPELPALRLTQDPVHQHKDLFHHTLAVLRNLCEKEDRDGDEPQLTARWAALLHDIGKPRTRLIAEEGVTFHHHEVVGAEMAERRLRELRYSSSVIEEVKELVYLHMRFHSYGLGWTDKAVRRYVRDAGALLGQLNLLVRSDCTTRNPRKAQVLEGRMDELEDRVKELAAKEEIDRMRPALDGNEVMKHLQIPPGPQVGEAMDLLNEIRIDEGEISKEAAYQKLDQWWADRGKQ